METREASAKEMIGDLNVGGLIGFRVEASLRLHIYIYIYIHTYIYIDTYIYIYKGLEWFREGQRHE